jgi:hypothetical protein
VIKSWRVERVVHAELMEGVKVGTKILVEKPEGTLPLGRPNIKIKIDHKETRCVIV